MFKYSHDEPMWALTHSKFRYEVILNRSEAV